ncbi:MAG: amylosucrase [Puniceicoccaceae bacterium]
MEKLRLEFEARRSLRRIRPAIEAAIQAIEAPASEKAQLFEVIDKRLDEHWETLFSLLYRLYSTHYDFFYYLENITLTAINCWLERPEALRTLDRRRENDPGWYLSERMVGGSLYVDLFAGDLSRLREKIPYLRDLGLTYLHLMPLLASRPGNSDGGYAVSDYRNVEPRLGSIEELRALANELRACGISLVLDFILNHTSDDHEWAVRAQKGDEEYRNYYLTFPDREIPDQYERHLREIFPSVRRGNFSWHPGLQRWVWTTFNNFQWDLNYRNPEVLRAMASEMLFLANTGVEILRLDAVAFLWKTMGTNCENLPEAHLVIQAFNAVCRIAAPGLVFKSEAIVHPDEVIRYIDRRECQLSYNPTLMALLWEASASREIRLLKQSLSHRHTLPPGTVWVNYLRGHDDIGWSFDNTDAERVGINPADHRSFLNRFYTGSFPGSFARGLPFQFNDATGDMRVAGTMASLAGLEEALETKDPLLLEMAFRRIRMLYSVLASIGGIPLIFVGEEWGLLNDYEFVQDPEKLDDTRWLHRPKMDWDLLESFDQANPVRRRIFRAFCEIFASRRSCPALSGNHMELLPIPSNHVLAFRRWHDASELIVLANFADREATVDLRPLRALGLAHFMKDLFSEEIISTGDGYILDPYQVLWLEED